jgi:hypothetical protein
MALQHLDSTLETLRFCTSTLQDRMAGTDKSTKRTDFLRPSERQRIGTHFLLCAGTLTLIQEFLPSFSLPWSVA